MELVSVVGKLHSLVEQIVVYVNISVSRLGLFSVGFALYFISFEFDEWVWFWLCLFWVVRGRLCFV